MSLKERITEDIKKALKEKDKDSLQILRFLSSAVKNKEIALRPQSITEEEILNVIRKLKQQTKDAIEQSKKANRKDLIEQSESELKFFDSYLPSPLSEQELKQIVQGSIKDLEAVNMKDMGRVMKEALRRAKGRADKKALSQLIRGQLVSLEKRG